ncbi:MAG: glycosyltransferase family 87 protein [Corynebacterium sp.]|nr:glycosyltransferase family 87 protein [Corynebacterium sp.]
MRSVVSHRATSAQQAMMPWYIVLYAIFIGWLQATFTNGRLLPDDWGSLWVAGQLHRDGFDSELYNRDPDDFALPAGQIWYDYGDQLDFISVAHPFVHNPLVAHWMSGWVSIQDFSDSVYTLTWLSGTAIVVMIAACYYLWFERQIPLVWLVGLSIALLINPMYQSGIWLGQTSALIYAMVFTALALSKTDRWWVAAFAGILLASAGFVKITPLLLIPVLLVFSQRRRTGIIAVIFTGLFGLWSLLVVPRAVLQTWWDNLRDLNDSVLLSPNNQSLPAWFLDHEKSGNFIVEVLRDPPTWATVLPVAIAGLIGLLLLGYAFVDRDHAFNVLSIGGFTLATLFGRLVWNHYYIVLVGIVLGIIALGAQRRYAYILTMVACFLFYPPIGTAIGTENPFSVPYHGLLAALILLGTFLIVLGHNAWEIWRKGPEVTGTEPCTLDLDSFSSCAARGSGQ